MTLSSMEEADSGGFELSAVNETSPSEEAATVPGALDAVPGPTPASVPTQSPPFQSTPVAHPPSAHPSARGDAATTTAADSSTASSAAREIEGPPTVLQAPTEGCEAVVAWTAAELRLLLALPEPCELVEDHVWCALEADHVGPHWALGQLSCEDDYWWLRWDDTCAVHEFVHRDVCGRYAHPGEPGEPHVPCVLPADHVGAHSFTRPA